MNNAPETPDRGWCGDPRRGASMGRPTIDGSPTNEPFSLRRVPINNGGYDSGGSYWGIGQPLYFYQQDGLSGYFRAKNRDEAKAELRRRYPSARFHR